MENLSYKKINTSKGEMHLLATNKGICWFGLPNVSLDVGVARMKRFIKVDKVVEGSNTFLNEATKQLEHYLNGEKTVFTFPLDLYGTPFQLSVWQAMQNCGYGKIGTYRNIAYAINHPKAVRAVGTAIGANPIPVIIPCHRIIGTNGKLVGYAGGLEIKKWLLAIEGIKQPNLYF